MIRNYILGITETLALKPIGIATGASQYVSLDDVYKNGFNSLVLYTDAGGASPVPGAAYSMTTVDSEWTEDEAGTGGTGETVYSQYAVTNATYQGIPLWADIENYGTYTDNDAPFSQIGGTLEVSASGTVVPSEGLIRQIITSDTSGGAVTITVDVPAFIGQDVFIRCDGAGLTDVDFPGKLATGNVVVSDGFMLRLTAISLTEYVAVNEVTADYISGDFQIVYTSGNILKQTITATVASLSISPQELGNVKASTPYPVAFLTVTANYGTGSSSGRYTFLNSAITAITELTETGGLSAVNVTNAGTTSDVIYRLTREGTY
jgi:hypothetical protein